MRAEDGKAGDEARLRADELGLRGDEVREGGLRRGEIDLGAVHRVALDHFARDQRQRGEGDADNGRDARQDARFETPMPGNRDGHGAYRGNRTV